MTHDEAQAIVSQMTLDEKVDWCSGRDVWRLPQNQRFDLPSIMLTDGPHGLRKAQVSEDSGLAGNLPATCFPTASALASTWNLELLNEIGVALGKQAAAAEVGVLLGPGMNIKRHPLCGRNFEYFSEDPLLSGSLAAAMIEGVQSQGVGACVKHFAANDQEHRRMVVDVIADERTLREIHLRGFEIAVRQAKPWTVMSAYNRINGIYCSEHDWLLNRVLRDDWGFDGTVMTDWGAANDRVQGIRAGNDLEMPTSGGVNDRRLAKAVRDSELDEADLERSVVRVLELVFKHRDGANQAEQPDFRRHHTLAYRAAVEGAVLLTNTGLLPLCTTSRVAVIGEFAKQPRFQGTGSSRVTPTQVDCAIDAIEEICADQQPIAYAKGYDAEYSEEDSALVAEAVALAADVDVAVVFVGLPSVYESEGFDRSHMRLPAQHDNLVEAVCAAQPNTVVVLTNGAPVEMPWVDEPAAILEAYLSGQASGTAVADLLYGRCSPSGKLAETFPVRLEDTPSHAWFPGSNRQVQYREGLYVGYRYFDSFDRPVRFPFGHGLSYTEFQYDELDVRLTESGSYEVDLVLTNVGTVTGAETVQVYVHPLDVATPYRPVHSLCGFAKVSLNTGERRKLIIQLDDRAFDTFNVQAGGWETIPGTYEIRVGASSRDIRLRKQCVVEPAADDVDIATTSPGGQPTFENGRLVVSDAAFAAMLGKPIPPAENIRPFHLNSTLAEIEHSWLGQRIATRLKSIFSKRMGVTDASSAKMVERMADDMTVRSMVLFLGGKLSFATAEALVAAINGRYFAALSSLLRQ